MRADCEAFVKGCVLCSVLKTKNEGRVIVGTPRVVNQPRKSWMIDQVTGLPPIEGFSSYLTIVDLFSGYCTARVSISLPFFCFAKHETMRNKRIVSRNFVCFAKQKKQRNFISFRQR
jgi:hypothetical protein